MTDPITWVDVVLWTIIGVLALLLPRPVEAVPVAYQQRESRDDGKTWSDWYPTTKEAFEEYTRNGASRYVSGKWTFEVRALYAHPPAQATPHALNGGKVDGG